MNRRAAANPDDWEDRLEAVLDAADDDPEEET